MRPLQPTRYRQETEARAPLVINQPLGVTQLQATLTTIYTTPDEADARVVLMWVAEVSGNAETLTLHAVPSGDSASDANVIYKAAVISANTTQRLIAISDASGGGGLLLAPGTTLQASCGTNDQVNIGGWIQEIRGREV